MEEDLDLELEIARTLSAEIIRETLTAEFPDITESEIDKMILSLKDKNPWDAVLLYKMMKMMKKEVL